MGKSQKYEQIINKHTTEMKLGQMDDQEAFIKWNMHSCALLIAWKNL